ncbi:subclass B1 metallo-beta-lactamase [Echinicola sp. CAU 1574]|uniref:beta-lactamase n=1 Tax=Echinicola arenosa TaxID=2774144 RepID=A0ABR9AGE9_9BACT|nr:subclass B1 metallo-beta-lactamase [Echinicola arenosa]MBD8487311.1 subclass B1 metallo-beta-lactamase [Echinicola arenosa]
MNKNILLPLLILTQIWYACNHKTEEKTVDENKPIATSFDQPVVLYTSNNLIIKKVSPAVYEHITYLQSETFGKVECNGIIVVDEKEAVVFDTPANDNDSYELIKFIQSEMNLEIKAVVPTHFHIDCLGGLDAFHELGIPSYANNKTIHLADKNQFKVPQNGFDSELNLKVGDLEVLVKYFGPGHTQDNVVVYIPEDQVVFGGCLIKSMGAGKGNLADADTMAWSYTVTSIQRQFPQSKVIIPGHGSIGNTGLLDYTIKLFEEVK